MAAGGSICCRVGSLSALICKTDTHLLLMQLAAAGLDKLNDITVRHAPSMPDSDRVTSGYKTDQKDTFHQLAEINSLFGAGVSLCRPCGACAQPLQHSAQCSASCCHGMSLPRWPAVLLASSC